MKNETLKKRINKIAVAYGYENRVDEIVDVIEHIFKKEHIDVKAVVDEAVKRLQNNESFDGLIPKKKREESEATKNARYEKALAKLNAKYGRN